MSSAGEAWNCPHCGERILRSAVSCPACQRRLRFDAGAQASSAAPANSLLHVEGTIRHAATERALEYSVTVQVRDAQGAIVARHVVGVGAIHPGDVRTFTLQVEARPSEESAHVATSARSAQSARGKTEARKIEAPSSSRLPTGSK